MKCIIILCMLVVYAAAHTHSEGIVSLLMEPIFLIQSFQEEVFI